MIGKWSELLTALAMGLLAAFAVLVARGWQPPTPLTPGGETARLRAPAPRPVGRPDRRPFTVHVVRPSRLALEQVLPRAVARTGQGILERGFVDPAVFAPLQPPRPRLVRRRDFPDLFPTRRIVRARTDLVALASAPFPYDGEMPGGGRFLAASLDGEPAHRTASGRLFGASQTYGDSRSLLHIPAGFDAKAPGVLVLYFHGHGAKLARDVWHRQRLPDQISASGVNAVLVAPQFAVDARDSSIGRFWQRGALRRYLDDVAVELARLYGDPSAARHFARLPVVIVGYSGGYVPAAYALTHGGIRDRVRGVVLLDALYARLGTFDSFIKSRRSAFFVSAFGRSTRSGNAELQSLLSSGSLRWRTELPPVLGAGEVVIVSAPAAHRDFVTEAWTRLPVADVLRRLPWVSRTSAGTSAVSG